MDLNLYSDRDYVPESFETDLLPMQKIVHQVFEDLKIQSVEIYPTAQNSLLIIGEASMSLFSSGEWIGLEIKSGENHQVYVRVMTEKKVKTNVTAKN